MSQKLYKRLRTEYQRKTQSRQQNATTTWEKVLHQRIIDVIRRGLHDKAKWAIQAANEWGIDNATS